jgi:hypothetical protein
MNGYELSRKFVDFSFENPSKIRPNHYALYFFAIEHCNRLGWKKEFGLPTTMTMEAIGIKSYNTYSKTFNELVEFGFFKLIEKSKNQYSANIIALSNFNKALDKALDKAFIKHTTKHCRSTRQSIDSINKQETNKQINNKQVNNDVKDFILYNTDELVKFYLNNENIVKAFIGNEKNKVRNLDILKSRLDDFKTHLEETGDDKKEFKDFCSHFRNWNGKIKPKGNSTNKILL